MTWLPTTLDPDFVANAPIDAIRAQYKRAQHMADLWTDRARDLFLLLDERTPEGDPPCLT